MTTPPCTERVDVTVFNTLLTINQDKLLMLQEAISILNTPKDNTKRANQAGLYNGYYSNNRPTQRRLEMVSYMPASGAGVIALNIVIVLLSLMFI